MQEILDKYKDAEFQYGQMDCCLFVCSVIQDMTGRDYAVRWRGTYKTEFGALRTITKYGSLRNIASVAFGKMKPIWSVKKGDPVLLSNELVEHDSVAEGLGVFDGKQIVYLTEKGLAQAPVMAGRGCWNV